MKDIRNVYNVECPRAKGMNLEQAPDCIWTEPGWVIETKVDGNRATLQIGDGYSLLVGRNRQDFLKGVAKAKEFRCLNDANPSLTRLAEVSLEGTVLDGELTETFNKNGEWSKDTKTRYENGAPIGFITWGAMFWKGVDIRCCDEIVRREFAISAISLLRARFPELKDKLHAVDRVPATKENLQKFFDAGEEGAIAKKLLSTIPDKARAHPYWWKLKADRTRTVMAYVTGVSAAKEGGSGLTGVKPKPNGKAATFTISMMDICGNEIEVGKMGNLPDTATQHGLKYFDMYDRAVVEVMVSGWNGDSFRFPRFVRWLTEKKPVDCLFQTGGRK